jgi:hypothetical protein
MKIGDMFELNGHEMVVEERKESLDLEWIAARCSCHSYPRNLYIECTVDDLTEMQKKKCECPE